MDFRTINKFNIVINTVSGNFFPTSGEKTDLGIIRRSYLIFTWLIELIYQITSWIGMMFYVPAIVAIRDGGVSGIVTFEILTLIPYLTFRQEKLRKLIGMINGLLVDTDDFRQCIRESVDPHKKRLMIYAIWTISSVVMWGGLPLFKLLNWKDDTFFTYTDFVIPTYFPGAPFTVNIFVFAVVFQMIGAGYLICKKSATDVYVSYLITLLTAEYRHVNRRIVRALNRVNGDESDDRVIASLQRCVQQHCIIMEAGSNLTGILSLNVGLTYVNCILRFCFVGFSFMTLPEVQAKVIFGVYMLGTMTQVYMLCLCAQELLEASTAVTDDAFHESWYERGSTVKSMLLTMGLGNKLECRITAFRVVDLTVPTFALILNQAYSALLLLLRVY